MRRWTRVPDPIASRRRQLRIAMIAALLLAGGLCLVHAAFATDDSVRISTNSDFADGLNGWQATGAVRIAKSLRSTHAVVTIGPGAGAIAQRIQTGAANHLMVSVIVHAEPPAIAVLKVRCLDQDGRELMRLESPGDIKPGKDPDSLSDYFRPHPLTMGIEISVSSSQSQGSVTIEHLELDTYKDDDPTLRSTEDPGELLVPFWQGNRVFREAVLLTSTGQQPATGTLMFRPARILSVTSYDGAIQYQQGADYTVTGRTIAAAGSRISRVRDQDLLHADLAWNVIGGKQVLVTYEHDDAWTGPVQHSVIDALPNTLAKLRGRQPLRIVAYGDSITYGLGSSHMQKLAPYQSPWIDLFTNGLKKTWQDPGVVLFNASQSGGDSDWARQMAGRMVATLNPDLAIVAFGQNDFWSHSAAAFSENIAAVLSTVRATNPNAEFLLVSATRFDPAYSVNPTYWDLVTQFDDALRAMTGRGVQLVDMTDISGAVFAAKEPRDCLNDPLHPNDYLSRWFAQSMLAALMPIATAAQPTPPGPDPAGKKGVGDDDKEAPEAIDATHSSWYYNWTPRRSTGAIHAAFVPMLWGATSVDSDLAAAVASGAKELLAFNEPDSESQGNVTVDQAIALWPGLEATGLRLGSPATTTGSPWIDQFMDKANQKHLRVDFLCLHWYGDITANNAVGELQKYLQSYWDRYHLPIWLTEYSGADFSFHLRHTTTQDNAAFATASAAMMDRLPFVERYAWFGTQWTPESKDYPTSGLYENSRHTLTPVGIAWRDAGSGQP